MYLTEFHECDKCGRKDLCVDTAGDDNLEWWECSICYPRDDETINE